VKIEYEKPPKAFDFYLRMITSIYNFTKPSSLKDIKKSSKN